MNFREKGNELYAALGFAVSCATRFVICLSDCSVVRRKAGIGHLQNCRNLIRTLPALVYGRNSEDVDDSCEQHAVDALRYALMRKIITFLFGARLRHLIGRQKRETKIGLTSRHARARVE
jgi:hypothetical protein